MSDDENIEMRSKNNDEIELMEVEMKEENEQMDGENEASTVGNSQQNSADSTIAIPTSQEDEMEEEELYVPNWLIEVLEFITRIEMANSSLSISCKLFKQLCWTKLHRKVKPYKISNIECRGIHFNVGNYCAHFRHGIQFRRLDTNAIIQIPSTPAPNYIDGFGTIHLIARFVNEQVFDFIKCIDRLLQNCDLCVKFTFSTIYGINTKYATSIHYLLECLVNKMFKFNLANFGLSKKAFLTDFNRIFPGILDQIQYLQFYAFLNIDDIDTILNWLTNQNDGKQRIFEFVKSGDQYLECIAAFISRIAEEFSNSNSPSNFFIYIYGHAFNQNVEEFTLENERTNEILASYLSQNGHNCYLARYPKGEEEQWRENMENKFRKADLSNSTIIIDV